MSLRAIPVDADRIRFVVIDVEPVADFSADGSRSGKQRADTDGVPLWRVNTLAMVDGVAGGETTPVRIAGDYAPALAALSEIKFTGLVAKPWSQGDRSGVSLVAEGIDTGSSTSRQKVAAASTSTTESS